jgi:hypothetical protein
MEEKMWITVLEVAKELNNTIALKSNDCSTVRNQINRLFPGSVQKVVMPGSGRRQGMAWAIPLADKEKILEALKPGRVEIQPVVKEKLKGSASGRAKEIFEKAGWVCYLLACEPVGTPDLVMFKDGVTRYREVKATGDRVSKEQWSEIFRLRGLGFDAWVCDDQGTDWPI